MNKKLYSVMWEGKEAVFNFHAFSLMGDAFKSNSDYALKAYRLICDEIIKDKKVVIHERSNGLQNEYIALLEKILTLLENETGSRP